MRGMVEKILKQYGTDLILNEKTKIRGFFQPVLSKNFQNMVSLETPLGEIPRGQYVYIGSASVAVAEGDTLRVGIKNYVLRRVESYDYGGSPAYIWGLCVEKGVNDTWGSQS